MNEQEHGTLMYLQPTTTEVFYRPEPPTVAYEYMDTVHGQLVKVTRYKTPAYRTYTPAWDDLKTKFSMEVYK